MPSAALSIRPAGLKPFDNASFFVTGAASGLGEATARMIAGAGGFVLLADLNDVAGVRLAEELGVRARFALVAVTDEHSVTRGLDVAAELAPIRGVVNAAGIVLAERVLGKTGSHPLDAFERVIRINLTGTFNVIRLAAARMSTNDASPSG